MYISRALGGGVYCPVCRQSQKKESGSYFCASEVVVRDKSGAIVVHLVSGERCFEMTYKQHLEGSEVLHVRMAD